MTEGSFAIFSGNPWLLQKALINNTAPVTYHSDVAELVSTSHGVIVQQTGRRDPALVGVVGEYDKLVLRALVADKVETVLAVRDHDAISHRVDSNDAVRNVLKHHSTAMSPDLYQVHKVQVQVQVPELQVRVQVQVLRSQVQVPELQVRVQVQVSMSRVQVHVPELKVRVQVPRSQVQVFTPQVQVQVLQNCPQVQVQVLVPSTRSQVQVVVGTTVVASRT